VGLRPLARAPNQGWDPVAIALRRTISLYLERFPTYDDLPFRAITMWDELNGRLMDIELKRVLIAFRGKKFRVYMGPGVDPAELLVWRIRHPRQRPIEE
jgi:hypothetical protein